MDKPHKLTHLELLETALEEPGMLSTSFNKFYNYSLGNSLGVQIQCLWRGQEPNFFMSRKKWEEIGRSVKEDQKRKALFIWIPTTKKYQRETENPDTGEIEMQSIEYRTFVYRPRVYTLEQTEGKEVELLQPPDFDIYKACDGLDIEIIPFVHSNGNAGG